MGLRIFHPVNSGLYIKGSSSVLVDGIFGGRGNGFSQMPEAFRRAVFGGNGSHIDGMLFTHSHEDHFCQEQLKKAEQLFPHMTVYGPELTAKNVEPFLTAPGLTEFDIDSCRVWAADTIHDGDRYRDVPHCSYFLEMDGQTVFIAGDGSNLGELKKRYGRLLPNHVDVVFVNLYQAFAQNVHQFIRDFTASRIYLYHLPFRQDDCYQFWMQAGQAVRSFPSDLPPLKILTHMNWH